MPAYIRIGLLSILVLGQLQCQCTAERDPKKMDQPLDGQKNKRRIGNNKTNPLQNQNRVPGEYIVILIDGEDEAAIKSAFGHLQIRKISALGNQTHLIVFIKDPQLPVLEAIVKKESAVKNVQPNFIYNTLK